ncbi:MAG: tetratricopeptide repeat protein [Anaerolineae bacterium]
MEVLGAGLILLSIVIFIFIIVFRPQIGELLSREKVEVSRGETKIAFEARAQEPSEEAAEEEQGLTEFTQAAEEIPGEREEGAEEDPQGQAISALLAGDKQQFETIFGELIDKAPDEEKVRLENGRLILLYALANETVANDLQQLIQKYPDSPLPVASSAHVYADSGNHARAAELYTRASELAKPGDKLGYDLSACQQKYKIGQYEEAAAQLNALLEEYDSDSQMSDIEEQLGRLFEEKGEKAEALNHLEKAVSHNPDKRTLRFRVAHEYTKLGDHQRALYHYKVLNQLDPDDAAVLNNLGVAYDALEMPIKAVECYKRSAEKGHTIAMGNLVHLLVDSGFINEAERWIAKAQEHPPVHTRVGTALGRIAPATEAEDEKEGQILKDLRHGEREEFPEEEIPF